MLFLIHSVKTDTSKYNKQNGLIKKQHHINQTVHESTKCTHQFVNNTFLFGNLLQYDPNKDVNSVLEIQIHSLELFRNTRHTGQTLTLYIWGIV